MHASRSLPRRWTNKAPAVAPTKVQTTEKAARRRSTAPLWMKLAVAVKLPNTAWALLVARAETGGSPDHSKAGTEISPPPPAIESTSPASRASTNRMTAVSANSTTSPSSRMV